MDERGGLIRTDGLRRLRFTADQRRALLDGFEGSSLSASRFAVQHGVKYHFRQLAPATAQDPSGRSFAAGCYSGPHFLLTRDRGLDEVVPFQPATMAGRNVPKSSFYEWQELLGNIKQP